MADDNKGSADSANEDPSHDNAASIGETAHGADVASLAELLGISPTEAYSTIRAHAEYILALAHPKVEVALEENLDARSRAWNLAVYALQHDLPDNEVAAQWRTQAGEAWNYATKKSDELAADLNETTRELARGLLGNLPVDNVTGRGFAASLARSINTGALGGRQIPAVPENPALDAIKQLQSVNRDLADPMKFSVPSFDAHKMDRELADIGRANRERQKKEQQWRDDVVEGLARLAEVTDDGNQKLTALIEDGSRSSRRLGWSTIALMVLTLIVMVVIAVA